MGVSMVENVVQKLEKGGVGLEIVDEKGVIKVDCEMMRAFDVENIVSCNSKGNNVGGSRNGHVR